MQDSIVKGALRQSVCKGENVRSNKGSLESLIR